MGKLWQVSQFLECYKLTGYLRNCALNIPLMHKVDLEQVSNYKHASVLRF